MTFGKIPLKGPDKEPDKQPTLAAVSSELDSVSKELEGQGLIIPQKIRNKFPGFIGNIHWIPIAKYIIGPVIALIIALVQQYGHKADTDHQADVSWKWLTRTASEQAAKIEEQKVYIAQLATTVQAQGALLLAGRPGFSTAGKPEAVIPTTPTHKKKIKRAKVVAVLAADPALVKKVQDDATKNQVIKDLVKKEPPAAPSLPVNLPKEEPPLILPTKPLEVPKT